MHLAQLNVGVPQGALDGPVMAEFMGNLDRINALAETSIGYVWRLRDESGNATAIESPFGPGVIVNLTVWRDVESLRIFTYRTEHALFLRRRRAWFKETAGPFMALWWVPEGHRPRLLEAKARLDALAKHGPTPESFTFTRAFRPDGAVLGKGERMASHG
ncbi:MAG: DUF3291 domain-containing protein [Geminicoccaceae bacterium]|nr:DUF3291 domain-containing protein [Geminicoccaceae bacterium]